MNTYPIFLSDELYAFVHIDSLSIWVIVSEYIVSLGLKFIIGQNCRLSLVAERIRLSLQVRLS